MLLVKTRSTFKLTVTVWEKNGVREPVRNYYRSFS